MTRPATPILGADLPGLPGVPATVSPVVCTRCRRPGATVHHRPGRRDGDFTAMLECGGCGASVMLDAEPYMAGLTVGVLVERGAPMRVALRG